MPDENTIEIIYDFLYKVIALIKCKAVSDKCFFGNFNNAAVSF